MLKTSLKKKESLQRLPFKRNVPFAITEGDNVLGISPTGTGKTPFASTFLPFFLKPKSSATAYPST